MDSIEDDTKIVDSLVEMLLSNDVNDVELGVGIWINTELKIKDKVFNKIFEDNKWSLETRDGKTTIVRSFDYKDADGMFRGRLEKYMDYK